MSCLSSLENNVHSLITQYPLGNVFPKFHITIFTIIPLAGAYFYYREYKNPPVNPNTIFLPGPRKTGIKFGDTTVSIVEKKPEEIFSFLPKRPPEEKTNITADIIIAVKENIDLITSISEALKLAFQNKFLEAKERLEAFTKDLPYSPAVKKEILRVIEIEKTFIDQLEVIAFWSPLEPFDDQNISKDISSPAGRSWEKAMQQATVEKRNENLVHFFALIEVGLTKGWFEPTNKERYESLFEEMLPEVNRRLEKTGMSHLLNRAYLALGSFQKTSIYPSCIEIPSDTKADEALRYLCQLAKYFHRLGKHEESLTATFEKIFLILKTNPLNLDECSKTFTLVLSCFTFERLDAINWALCEMRKSILENRDEAPQKKIELLLVIQNDYKLLGNVASSDKTLDSIIELIGAMPEDEKKPWVEKAALALNQMQLYEKADLLITKHNTAIEKPVDRVSLVQSIFLGVLALSTFFVRPFYPLCTCLIVPLLPTALTRHRT